MTEHIITEDVRTRSKFWTNNIFKAWKYFMKTTGGRKYPDDTSLLEISY